jgi:hypothetical protein
MQHMTHKHHSARASREGFRDLHAITHGKSSMGSYFALDVVSEVRRGVHVD